MSLRKKLILAREGASEELSLTKGNESTLQEATDSISDANDPKVDDLVEEDEHNNEFETEVPDENEDSSDVEFTEEDVNTIAILKEEEESLSTEFNNYIKLLDLEYDNDLSLESNLLNINKTLTELSLENIYISNNHILNNPNEAIELAKEGLVDIAKAVGHAGKQFWLFIKKWCKKIWNFVAKSYPFYKRVYKKILRKAVNIRKDLKVDANAVKSFINEHKFIVHYLSKDKTNNISTFCKDAAGPMLKGKNIFPVGEVDYLQFAKNLGHSEIIKNKITEKYKDFKTGVVSVEQSGSAVKYKLLITKLDLDRNNDDINSESVIKTVNIEAPFEDNYELEMTPEHLIENLKAYINIIDGLRRIYSGLSGVVETFQMFENKIKRLTEKMSKYSDANMVGDKDLNVQASKANETTALAYLKTFRNCDQLAQKFLKDYYKVLEGQLKAEANV